MNFRQGKEKICRKERLIWFSAIPVLLLICCFCFQGTVLGNKTFLWGGDNAMQSYAWLGKIRESLRSGEIALWDFNQYCGTSFAGEIQTAPFYFGNLLFALVTPEFTQHAVDLYILVHYFLGALFMFCFLYYNTKGYFASLAGGIFFAFIGSVSARSTNQSNIFMCTVYLPAVIWMFQAAVEARRNGKRRRFFLYTVFSGFFLGTMILAGHMQPYLHAVFALGLFTLCYSTSIRDFSLNLAALFLLGCVSVILSFGQIVSGLEYISLSYRWVGLPDPVTGFGSLPGEAYDLFVVQLSNLQDILFLHELEDGSSLYISIPGTVLALAGIASIPLFRRTDSKNRRLGIFALITTLLCLVLSFGRQTIFGQIFILLPGFGSIREPTRILYIYNFSVAILITAGIVFFTQFLEKIKLPAFFHGLLLLIGGILAVIAILIPAVQFSKTKQMDVNIPTTAEHQYEENELIQYLLDHVQQDTEKGYLYRYVCKNDETVLTPNLGSVYNELLGTHAHRATMPVCYYDYLKQKKWNWKKKLSETFAVKYYIADHGDTDETVLTNFTLAATLNGKDVFVRNHPHSLFTVITDGKTKSVKAKEIDQGTNRIAFTARFSSAGVLRIAQMNYPGWQATIDGEPVQIETDEDGFMTLSVSENSHRIELEYNPWWVRAWIILLILCLAFSAAADTIVRIRRKKTSQVT